MPRQPQKAPVPPGGRSTASTAKRSLGISTRQAIEHFEPLQGLNLPMAPDNQEMDFHNPAAEERRFLRKAKARRAARKAR